MSLYDDATFILTPNEYSAGSIYALKPVDGSGDMSVDRGSYANRVNSSRLLEYMSDNVVRLDYSNGTCPSILVEPQRTNICLQSNNVNDDIWGKDTSNGTLTVTPNYGISPDGTENATRLQMSYTSGGYSSVLQVVDTKSSIAFSYSVYIKSLSGTPTISFFNDGVTGNKVITLTNEWVKYTFNIPTSGVQTYPRFLLVDGLTSSSADILVYGAQLEAGSYATSYIPTTSASVTRNADVVSKTGISSLIGQTEGTLFLDFEYNGLTDNHMIINDAGFSSYIYFNSQNANQIWGQIQSVGIQFTTSATAGRYKCALAYKSGSSVMYINGVQVGTSSTTFTLSGSISVLDFTLSTPKNNINTSALWKTRLTNTQLAQLTTI